MSTTQLAAAPESAEKDTGRRPLRYRYPLGAMILRRILAGIATVFAASALVYAAIMVLPGDVATVILGRNATPERIAEVEAQLNLDAPVYERYFQFLGDLFTGNLGYSTAGLVQGVQIPVADIIGPAFANSAVLAAVTMILFIPLALGLGLLTGIRAYKPTDHVVSMTSLAISALPEFLVASALITIFFSWLGWLPPISAIPAGDVALSHPDMMALPVLTLLTVSLAFGSRMLRATVIDVMAQDYVTMARLSGFPAREVIRKYVLPNSLVSTVQIFAQQLQYLIGGIIVVEAVFNYPGIGSTLVRAIAVRDTQEIVVIATILAATYILINLVADLICIVLDPKIRTAV
ncbi:ABC transporter permease [Rhodococcus sp. NPDC057529]|uniref:ABC transporter permease n=1 Tax=Rhodococcus sp. NPDC057529 TaxID=3346158 RepID=UPI00366D642C